MNKDETLTHYVGTPMGENSVQWQKAGSKIFAAMTAIMSEVGSVAKTRTNEQQKYKFRGIEDFYLAVHPVFVKHKVFCVPQVKDVKTSEAIVKDKLVTRTVLTVAHRFYAEDGSFMESITAGEGTDYSDKATGKAMSNAMKYAFIETFSIPTEDVEDGDRTTPDNRPEQDQDDDKASPPHTAGGARTAPAGGKSDGQRVSDIFKTADEFERLLRAADLKSDSNNDFQVKFMKGMVDNWEKYGPKMFITQKQIDVLDKMVYGDVD